MLDEGVYKFLRPETLRALHFYMGVGGTDRFLSGIPAERWDEVDRFVVVHILQYCKCEGEGCMACELAYSESEGQVEGSESGK